MDNLLYDGDNKKTDSMEAFPSAEHYQVKKLTTKVMITDMMIMMIVMMITTMFHSAEHYQVKNSVAVVMIIDMTKMTMTIAMISIT